MTRKSNLKRRAQQTVAKVTRTADNADVVAKLRNEIESFNIWAARKQLEIKTAGVNNRQVAVDEVRRIEILSKRRVRDREDLEREGWQSVGNVAINKRLPDGYEYQYLPIIRPDGTADEHNAEVWRKAVSGE